MTRAGRWVRLAVFHPLQWVAIALLLLVAVLLWVADLCDVDLLDTFSTEAKR